MNKNDVWDYCYRLTKPDATIPVNKETVDALLLMFKEYQEVNNGLLEIGGHLNSCQGLIQLKELAKGEAEIRALLETVSLKISSIDQMVDKNLSLCEGI
jgi:hypothetical protein